MPFLVSASSPITASLLSLRSPFAIAIVKAAIDSHLFKRNPPIWVVGCSNESVHGQLHGGENTDSADTSIVAYSEEQFFYGVTGGVEWVASSRLGQADDVKLYSSCLHE
ncbi:unnamed protein product [Angiostrongylus costaricensis]|uniref:FIST_C domain-containing protein n=1 Tax=Angiostrongylus costaricensis TaxID=334426 RepID=A0A0R3PIZ5_ANGCS|nr:unnamed protein product [Angiostrongylus costaricensis]